MLRYQIHSDASGEISIETPLRGKELLATPWFNKGTAFSAEERESLGLLGKLPATIETLEQQTVRAYRQFGRFQSPIERHIFLNTLHETNQTLFYKLVGDHLSEMLPLIYTPVIGDAVQEYSHEYRRPRGLYITYADIDRMETILDNRTHPDIKVIVATDGEGVLGIGDQGVGAMCIPIAKLMVYTLCGGINPVSTLPIMLDVGTDNPALLQDPLYLGWRHPRLKGKEYDDFMQAFVDAVKNKFPKVFLHWEDFGRDNARRVLERYRHEVCSFNDDMQGTGGVALAAVMSAVRMKKSTLPEEKVLIFGAGTAGVGIADQICHAMQRQGLSESDARKRFWLFDKQGLLTDITPDVASFQIPYVRPAEEIKTWGLDLNQTLNLVDVIHQVKPTILIGTSTRRGAFDETVVKAMAKYNERPIIFPLSNPNEKCEAYPADVLRWTNGNALVATGSPFAPVTSGGRTIPVSQCNNALIFPGLGLGVLAAKATTFSDEMLYAAVEALSQATLKLSDEHIPPLLPRLEQARIVARDIAIAVAVQAKNEGVALACNEQSPEEWVDSLLWEPQYRLIKPV